MKTELVLLEDDQSRTARFRHELSSYVSIIKTIFVVTPILFGCMYLLMRDLPEEAFPRNFWVTAFFLPMVGFPLGLGIPVMTWFVRRKCVLSPKCIRLGPVDPKVASWRRVEEWRVEDVRDDPRHFTVEFRLLSRRQPITITVPDTYSKQEVRTYIQHCLAKAF